MKLLIGLLALAFLVAGPWVESGWAQKHSGCMCKMMGHGETHEAHDAGTRAQTFIKHANDLDLTKEPVTKLKKLDLDLERTRVITEAEIRVAEMDIAAMIEDETTNLTAVENRLKQKATLETGLRMATIKADRDALALLTPEQREKEETRHEEMMEEKHGCSCGMGGGMEKHECSCGMGGGMEGKMEGEHGGHASDEHDGHQDH